MKMEFQIDKNVPIPAPGHSKWQELRRACQAMEVGDSMLLDDKTGMKAAEFIRKIWDNPGGGRRIQRKATTRKEGNERRVWRVENDRP